MRFERRINFARRALARLAVLQNEIVVCDLILSRFIALPNKKEFLHFNLAWYNKSAQTK